MKQYTPDELQAILTAHAKWRHGEAGGTRAYLRGAYLRGADLRGADLSGAELRGADLSGAVDAWAQVAFAGHGECGRMLTALITKQGEAPVYQCGCFSGSLDELKAYIAKGQEEWKPSRTKAMEVVTELLAITRS